MLTQRKDETFFEYCISFWPAAPFFGVRWRFDAMAPMGEFFRPADVAADVARASMTEAKRAVEAAPIKAAPKAAEAAPAVAEAAARPASLYAARPDDADDLTLMKGVGPKLAQQLNELGVYRFAQVAAFSKGDLAWIDDNLSFKGRAERDDWVGQAKALS